MTNDFYVYAYLDPRKPGNFVYDDLSFDYLPFYIGKGKASRMYFHLWGAKHGKVLGNPHKFNKINSILSEGLEPIILPVRTALTSNDALRLEKQLISRIGKVSDKRGPLTNVSDGGESNPMDNTDVRERVRQYHLGAKRSVESRKRMSLSAKGKVLSEQHKERIGAAGKGNCYAGKKVLCTHITSQEKLIFPSVLQASKHLNVGSRSIYNFLKKGNKQNHVKGWHFSYEIVL
ncbi:hypothetical protein CPT_Mater208 [Bacillus phage Mater]|uniref:GIY-YIG domain-containing protein n=1 Tax=Bacillus phage Mater TaxID=1540090 RepID=A0A0A0RMS0_9CAUD|nr:hypothetical protein CPT_Mater208 [Bacillus phage Mater]AIW03365.1 hypothetical protein CPT_Mater208 [Bacillus phage Mater]